MDKIPEGAVVEEVATIVFGFWSSEKTFNIFSNRFDKLSHLCYKFFKICFDGIQPGSRSIYLKNEKMKETLLGYEEWSSFILGNTLGLHHKFRCNAGCLYHLLHAIESMEADEQGMERLNDKIKENTLYSDLDAVLEAGMYVFSLHRICFLFFVPFSSCLQLFVVTQLLSKQVKMGNIWRPKPSKDHLKK